LGIRPLSRSVRRICLDGFDFRDPLPQMRFDPAGEGCDCHIAVGAAALDAKMRDAVRFIEANELDVEVIDSEQRAHAIERSADAVLHL
jgi:hypothetical protein